MKDFPAFMKNPVNKVATASQYAKGIEGYVYDGVDGSQMVHWTYPESGQSAKHTHEFDEYMLVVQGRYILIIEGKRISLKAGDEYLIKAGVPHGGEAVAESRVIEVFGGKRANRVGDD